MLPDPELTYRSSTTFYWLTFWMRYGHFAVDVFIVLSGYCLMLPLAQSEDRSIPGGISRFIYRRARRILPPYWAALSFTILMILVSRAAHARVLADDGTVFHAANLMSHVFLVHNWFPHFSDSINLPMWTVALEWQIYFLFALTLAPIWRRWGTLVLVAFASILGMLPTIFLPSGYDLSWTSPWYIGLFSFGMAGTVVHFRPSADPPGLVKRLHWGWLVVGLFAACVIVEAIGMIYSARTMGNGHYNMMQCLWAKDMLVGVMVVASLVYLADVSFRPDKAHAKLGSALVLFLRSRPLALLGTFSYSLYLIHVPIGWTMKFVLHPLHMGTFREANCRLMLVPFYVLPMAYLFYLVFEKPFMSAPKQRSMRISGVDLSMSASMVSHTQEMGQGTLVIVPASSVLFSSNRLAHIDENV